jgi:hypothetical protein
MTKNMPVFIPSMDRAGSLFDKISTLTYIKRVKNPIFLVVPPDQVQRYQAALTNHGRSDVNILPCDEKGIAKTRQWIGKQCDDSNFPHFAMFDDDLNFAVRRTPENNALRPQTVEDTQEMLDWINVTLKTYAHVGISPRDAAKTESIMSGDKPLTLLNKRTLRTLCYRTKDFLSVDHGRVQVMEDFDVNLQLLRKGLWNCQTYWWTNDQRQTGSPGGCASYRSHEVHEASAHKLAELHQPFVVLREKVNKAEVVKSAKAFQKRTEVTIYWEKAAMSAGWKKGARA